MLFNKSACTECGECLHRCPYTDCDPTEASEQIRELKAGGNPAIVEECVTCFACDTFCPNNAHPFFLIADAQERNGTKKSNKAFYEMVAGVDEDPRECIQQSNKEGPIINICAADVIPGVWEGVFYQNATLLRGGDWESTFTLLHIGQGSHFPGKMKEKIENLANIAADTQEIIMAHEDCYTAFTYFAREFNIPVPFPVIHIAEYLNHELLKRKDRIQPLRRKIAVQKSCASRYTPETDSFYDTLLHLCGCQRVSRKFDRADALCCGAHVAPYRGFKAGLEYKNRNIQDALDNGADSLLFTCPYCALQMRDEAESAGLQTIYLPNLPRMAMNEQLTFHPSGFGDMRKQILHAVALNKGFSVR